MASWRYDGLDRGGVESSGVVVASDRASALRIVQSRGLTPLKVESDEAPNSAARAAVKKPAKSQASLTGSTQFTLPNWMTLGPRRPTLSRSDMSNLVRELATAIEAGLPLMQALRIVRKQAPGKSLPVILDALIDKVEAGQPLYEAMKAYGAPFDDMIIGMARAADASGRMPEILHQLADLLDRSVELKRELIGATVYPMIVASLILASVTLLVTVILPQLMIPLAGQPGMVLPLPTRILLSFAWFMSNFWWLLVLMTFGAIIAARNWLQDAEHRRMKDYALLKTPLLGKLLRDVAVARFTRTLGTLVSAGLPILQSLRITKDTLGNAVLMKAIEEVEEKVTTGQSLAEPLERCGFFPPLLIQIVNIGEKSGRLESMLLHAATAFDRQVNSSIKIFTKSLPPILLVIMAIIAGFVLAGILMPLLQLQSALGG
jgi:type II secretory pathway component PulF